MEATEPFVRKLRRLRRDRAARTGAVPPYIDQLFADELLDRLSDVSRSFRAALVIGAGTPAIPGALARKGLSVTVADPGFLWAERAGGVQCDEDSLPFGDDMFDLVIAAGTLDTVNDLPGALTLIRRTLRPDGLFLGAFVGAGSLPRLKRAMMLADLEAGGGAAPRIHPQIDVRAAGDLLMRAGFRMPVVDSHGVSIRFSTLAQLVDDLRATGATNCLALGSKPLGRTAYALAQAAFASEAEGDGKISERLEIIHLSGWSPSPDQPRPAPRGSGQRSLAEVLQRGRLK